MEYLWGIDLGGTKIEGAIIDPAKLDKPIARLRLPTNSEKGYAHIRAQIGAVIKNLSAESGLPLPKRVGMGTPGVVDPKTLRLKNSNTQCMNGEKLVEDLQGELGLEVVTSNDANCFALAEATLGAGRGFPTVFGVIIGTGVGGGVVIDGKVLYGCHGIAGEWGQLILDPNGPPSNYGTPGTVEAMIAGPALEHFYFEQSGEKRKLAEIVARVGTDSHAQATMDRLTNNFAKGIAMVIDMFDPHVIILGGGVGNIDALYSEETRLKIGKEMFNPTFDGQLMKPTLGDSAGVFGAAMLVA